MSNNSTNIAYIDGELYRTINLRQAIHWLAFGAKPVRAEYEQALRVPLTLYPERIDNLSTDEIAKKVDDAIAVLFIKLREGHIEASAEWCYEFTQPDDKREAVFDPFIEGIDRKVPSYQWSWDDVNWQEGKVVKRVSHSSDEYNFLSYEELELDYHDIVELIKSLQ